MLGRSYENRRTHGGLQAHTINNTLRLAADFNTKRTDHGRIEANHIFPSSISRNEGLIALFSNSFIPFVTCAFSAAQLLTKELDIIEVKSDQAQRLYGVRATVPSFVILISVADRQSRAEPNQVNLKT
jgi:hypothetical protein